MAVRLARSHEPIIAEEKRVARVRGGPWDGREVRLAPLASVSLSPELAWFPGLEAPAGAEFVPLTCAEPARRGVYHLVGASGCGKSTYARTLADEFLRANPGAPVWVICPDSGDPAYAGMPHAHLSPQILAAEQVGLATLADGHPRFMAILDDTEAVSDRKEAAAVDAIARELLERGRKYGAEVVYISHRGAAGRASRLILSEMTSVWIPIEAAASANTAYMLEKHCNIPAELRLALKRSSEQFGRHALFHLEGAHRYAVTPRKVFIVDEDETRAALRERKKAGIV